MLVKAEKDYRSKGVAFIAASVDDRKSRKDVPGFVSKYNVSLSIWIDASADDMARLEMGRAAPATAFLDPEGHIAFRVEGQLHQEELRARLDWLLGSRAGPAPDRMRKATGDQVQPWRFCAAIEPGYFVDTLLTAPCSGWGPKCEVAGPVYTRVTFENATSVPPVMQTCSVDGPFASKVAGPPFPVVVAVPVTTIAAPVVGGLKTGQTLGS
jgi:hypothetical protein